MKRKFILLFLACVCFVGQSFAQMYEHWFPKILAAKNVYVQLTGNSHIDNILKESFTRYWNACPCVFFGSETELPKERVPVFSVSGTKGNFGISFVLLTAHDIKRGYYDADWNVEHFPFYAPTPATTIGDLAFMFPYAVKEFNRDYNMSAKKVIKGEVTPSILKTKILLIPKEYTENQPGMLKYKVLVTESALATYKYSYKILPFNQIKNLIEDSSEADKYCYLSTEEGLYGEVFIFDCSSDNCIVYYSDNRNSFKTTMTDKDFKKISGIVDAGGPRMKK